MTKLFFITLTACLLGFTIKAQSPFTGTIAYTVKTSGKHPYQVPKTISVTYGKHFLKVWPEFADKNKQASAEELLFDYANNDLYSIKHHDKQTIKMAKRMLLSEPQLIPQAGPKVRIAGFSASSYLCKVSEMDTLKVWLADNVTLSVPDMAKTNSDLFMFGLGKLMLKVEKGSKDEDDLTAFSLVAANIKPLASLEKPFKLPEGYAFTDEWKEQQKHDSIMQAPSSIDTTILTVTLDSIQAMPPSAPPPPPPPPVKKPAPYKKPVKKKNVIKATAHRKEQT